jgi:sec-independent protein translocase protein TatC
MASTAEEEPPDLELEEEEGGPVKSFLEHLEDLRWVLIKSAVAVGVFVILCLVGANHVVRAIEKPLTDAAKMRYRSTATVTVFVGTNVWGKFRPGTNALGAFSLGSNQYPHAAIELVGVPIGSNVVLALQPTTNPILLEIADNPQQQLINLGPAAAFWIAFQVALYGGIIMASPFIIYFVGAFVLPALKFKEKKYVLRGFAIGTGLFMAGVSFCYFALMPIALNAAVQYSEWLGFSGDQWRAEEYIGFVCKFMLGMGLGFELPVVILTLVKIGILDFARLRAMRRYMIVINLVLGAILTTPEVITQILMFIPLQGLYELCVWIARYWELDESQKRRANIKLFAVVTILGVLIWAAWYFQIDGKRILTFLKLLRFWR